MLRMACPHFSVPSTRPEMFFVMLLVAVCHTAAKACALCCASVPMFCSRTMVWPS